MGLHWRRLALACLVIVSAAVAVAGGSAANRDGDPHFDAVPGPGRVTYAENIAYRATFTNLGGSTYTQVKFRMLVPYADFGSKPQASFVKSTCPSNPVTVSTTRGLEWICSFPNIGPGTPGTPQLVLTVVWKVPTLASVDNCDGCLKTNGRWTIKEGINDNVDPDDAFPENGIDLASTLLSAELQELDPTNANEAGGYETELEPCADALGAGSLRTKPTLHATLNPVATTVCLPSPIPSDEDDLGLATTILEEPGDDGNPGGHPYLGRAVVCIADLGENCGVEGSYDPYDFGTDAPVTFVFRIDDAALLKGDKITQVFHNSFELPTCVSNPAFEHGCVVTIMPPKGKIKFWTVVAKARTNGPWNW